MKIQRHANCDKCQLFDKCKTPWMESHGSDNPLILIVGEAPGEQEDHKGMPFVGKSGSLLRDTLEAIGVDVENDVRFTNVVKCRPPDNKIAKKYIDACKHYVADEIGYYDPAIVLLMGNSPLSAILGESGGITTWNGVTVERDGTTYAPLFHPAYILRDMTKFHDWSQTMLSVVEGAGKISNDKANYIYPKTKQDFKKMEMTLLESEYISYDVETADLDPFAPHNLLLAVSFSNGNVSYAYPIEHPEADWDDDMLLFVSDTTERILTDHNGKIIGHNIKFDQQHTRYLLGVDFQAGGDSMLLSSLHDSRAGLHGLKRLAGLHLNMFDYDRELQQYINNHKEANPHRGGSYAFIPLKILLPYSAMDADATYKLYWKLYAELPDDMLSASELTIAASNALAHLEYNGAPVDVWIAQRYYQIYGAEQQRLYDVINQDKHVQRMIKDKQQQLDDGIVGTKKKRQIYQFNPNSNPQLTELYFQRYKMPILAYTDAGNPSAEAKVMKAMVDEFPIVDTIRWYKLMGKMRGTYLGPAAFGGWWSGDGKVRSYYNLNGTVTGRLASSRPNLQNIPTPEKEEENDPRSVMVHIPVKNIFTHSHWDDKPVHPSVTQRNSAGKYSNGVLMSVDYSGMELRVFASLAKCYSMIDIHKSGADFHSMVAIMSTTGRDVYDITRDEANIFKKEHKAIRYVYKWTNWTLLYGGDENTLMNLYKIPKAEAQQTVTQYYEKFPEVLHYRTWCEEFASTHGYIVSPFGRREWLPYIQNYDNMGQYNKAVREAVNMPVQSGASDILLCALIIIDKYLTQGGWRTRLVNTVHDSIVLDVPYEEIDDVAHLCTDIMENIVRYAAEHLPFMDFSWLICPLKADVDVGTHYGCEVSYKEWKSGSAVI